MVEFPTRSQLPRLIRQRQNTKRLHDERRAMNVCINNPAHGKPVKGGRCAPCWETKKKSS